MCIDSQKSSAKGDDEKTSLLMFFTSTPLTGFESRTVHEETTSNQPHWRPRPVSGMDSFYILIPFTLTRICLIYVSFYTDMEKAEFQL